MSVGVFQNLQHCAAETHCPSGEILMGVSSGHRQRATQAAVQFGAGSAHEGGHAAEQAANFMSPAYNFCSSGHFFRGIHFPLCRIGASSGQMHRLTQCFVQMGSGSMHEGGPALAQESNTMSDVSCIYIR